MTSLYQRCSLYDSLPELETWYSSDEETDIPECPRQPSSKHKIVSFSTLPPSVHHLREHPSPVNKKVNESNVRSFIKHCANKLGHSSFRTSLGRYT
ncbi:hypothetical protein BDF14DRAFT_1777912 [Spinellus fusiger]|nr:hypothetical protein BDF14DRAFT_1777912 [Spinellus fusiger]